MDSVLLSDNSTTREGLRDMMDAADDAGELVQIYVDPQTALLIIEVAKRAKDTPEWFPRGKWATIQAIKDRVERTLDQIQWRK